MRGFAPYVGLMIEHPALEHSNRIIFAKRVNLGACYEKETTMTNECKTITLQARLDVAAAEIERLQEAHKLVLPTFILRKGVGDGRVWIGRYDEEGGDFDIEDFDKIVGDFYNAKF